MVQAVLGNSSFVFLFFAMLLYWFEACFPFTQPRQLGAIGMKVSNLLLLCLLIFRWWEDGHYPLSNLYESLIFLAWSITLADLLLETVYGMTIIGAILSPLALLTLGFADFSLPKQLQEGTSLVPALRSNWLVMHVTVMIFSYAALLIGCLFAITYLAFSSQTAGFEEKAKPSKTDGLFGSNRNPRFFRFWYQSFVSNLLRELFLRSNRFETKTNIGDYSFQIKDSQTGCSVGTAHAAGLKQSFDTKNEKHLSSGSLNRSVEPAVSPLQSNIDEDGDSFVESLDQLRGALDNLSYRTIGLGFSFLTIGILSGAVWANEAWGSYWSWDPKETWALVTWITFAIYLHTRITQGWGGKKSATIATFGFVVVWVCFLGVNLFAKGLHSYGWVT